MDILVEKKTSENISQTEISYKSKTVLCALLLWSKTDIAIKFHLIFLQIVNSCIYIFLNIYSQL